MLRRITGFLMASAVTQSIAILVGIVQARTLGPGGKSVLAYAAVGLSLVLTATDGLTSAILAQSARDKRSAALVHAALLRTVGVLALPATVLIVAAGILFPSQRPLIGAALVVPFAVYVQGTHGLLLAAGAARSIIVQDSFNTVVFGIILAPLLIFAHLTPYAALALWIVGWIASAVYGFYACRRLDEGTAVAPAPAIRPAVLEQIRWALKNGAVSLAGFINLRIDVFLVSAVMGARELGIYTLSVATGELLWSASQPICWSNLDRVAGAPFAEASALVVRLTRNMFAIQVGLAVIVALVAPWLLTVVYGARFAQSGLVLMCLLPGMALYAARMLMGYFVLVRLDRPLLLTLTQGASALACAVISLLLFPSYGIVGAAVATSVTYSVVVVFIAFVFCRATGTPPLALIVPTREDFAWYERRAAQALQTLARTMRHARQP